jgi:hypothetical protein
MSKIAADAVNASVDFTREALGRETLVDVLLSTRVYQPDVSHIGGYSRRPERGRACDLALLMELRKAVQ